MIWLVFGKTEFWIERGGVDLESVPPVGTDSL